MTRCKDKPYSQEGKTDLAGYFYSGLHGKALKGINLVTLFYADEKGLRAPVNFRAVDKALDKTKNDLFREMVEEALAWGLRPSVVTADSWCSGVETLRFLRDQGLSFMIALEKNRTVSEKPGFAFAGGRRRSACQRQGHVLAPLRLGERVPHRR
jgi:hypothetical protein